MKKKKEEIEKGTDLGKWTHQCNETQGNNSAPVLWTKMVFFRCKKREIDQQKKKEAKKRTDKKGVM